MVITVISIFDIDVSIFGVVVSTFGVVMSTVDAVVVSTFGAVVVFTFGAVVSTSGVVGTLLFFVKTTVVGITTAAMTTKAEIPIIIMYFRRLVLTVTRVLNISFRLAPFE